MSAIYCIWPFIKNSQKAWDYYFRNDQKMTKEMLAIYEGHPNQGRLNRRDYSINKNYSWLKNSTYFNAMKVLKSEDLCIKTYKVMCCSHFVESN